MNTCKHCSTRFHGPSHYCEATNRRYNVSSDSGDFLLSAAIGMATDSALLGGLLGGDFAGGIVGDMLDGNLFD